MIIRYLIQETKGNRKNINMLLLVVVTVKKKENEEEEEENITITGIMGNRVLFLWSVRSIG